jgi:hypothetical protein
MESDYNQVSALLGPTNKRMHMRTLEERIAGPDPVAWRPEKVGDQVIGELEEISERNGDHGPYRVLTLLAKDGSVHNVAGFGEVLASKFARLTDADLGKTVAVVFKGTHPSKTNGYAPYKDFKVLIEAKTSAGAVAGFPTDDYI